MVWAVSRRWYILMVFFLFHLNNLFLGRSNVACRWRSIFISRKSNIRQVRYLLQLLSAVVCAADGRRVVWAVSRRPSHGVSGSFDDRRPSSLRTTIVVSTKIAWCVPSFLHGPQRMRIQPIRNSFMIVCARIVTFYMLACNGKGWWTYTNVVFLSSRRHNLPPKLKLRIVRMLKPHFEPKRASCDTSMEFCRHLVWPIISYFMTGPQPDFVCGGCGSHFQNVWHELSLSHISANNIDRKLIIVSMTMFSWSRNPNMAIILVCGGCCSHFQNGWHECSMSHKYYLGE